MGVIVVLVTVHGGCSVCELQCMRVTVWGVEVLEDYDMGIAVRGSFSVGVAIGAGC